MLSIRTNMASLTAQRSLTVNQNDLNRSLARLSSGEHITTSADDPAGSGLSTNLKSQIRSYGQAAKNAAFGQSLMQTSKGALNEVTDLLTRLRELAEQSASDGVDRDAIQTEADEIIEELDRLNASTEFNGTTFFGAADPFTFQVGIRDTADDVISIDTGAMEVDSATLGVDDVDLSVDAATSLTFFQDIDDAITAVNDYRAQVGSFTNRLSSVADTIQGSIESLTAANSIVSDTDIAAETSALSRAQILLQATVAMLAQANQQPAIALKLLE